MKNMFRKTMLILAVAALATSTLAASKTPPAARVPVYIFTATDPSGFVDADTQMRLLTVAHLRDELRTEKKLAKVMEVVDTADASIICVEITGLSEAEVYDASAALSNTLDRLSQQLAGRPTTSSPKAETKKVTLRHARLSVGEYSTELASAMGRPGDTGLNWVLAAWVNNNHARLLAQ